MRRRQLLIGGGGLAGLSLLGAAGATVMNESASDEEDGDRERSADAETVLELVPAGSALDMTYQFLHYTTVEDADEIEVDPIFRDGLDELDEIDRESVSEVVSATTQGHVARVTAVIGSFDQPLEETDDDGDWTVKSRDDETAIVATEDHAVVAAGEEPTDIAETVDDTVQGEADSVLSSPEHIEAMIDRLDTRAFVALIPSVEDDPHLEFDGKVTSIAVGFDEEPFETSGTTDAEYVLAPDSDADVDDDWIVTRLERVEQGELVETSIDRSDGLVHVDAVVDQPPERDREAAPDAEIRVRPASDEGTATIEHVEGASIDTAELEVWLDGELADDQLADEYDSFEPDDQLELETGPLADVGVRWIDENEDVYYYYDTALVGEDAFESRHDPETDSVQFTYTGEREADPDRIDVIHWVDDDRHTQEHRELDGVSGSLTTGETITIDDVELGDRVTLELAVPANPNRGQRSLARVRLRPPRVHIRQHTEDVIVRYSDEQERAPDEFRVLVDGDPADVQFTDVAETLSSGEELELGDLAHGTSVAVEWLEPDESVTVDEAVVRPTARFELTYDDADGTVTTEHVEGDVIDADKLELQIGEQPAADQFADEYDTVEPGDEFTIDAEPFDPVELVWVVPEDGDDSLGRVTPGEGAFDATYDGDTDEVELVYTGEQSADPAALSIDHTGRETSEQDPLFAEEYDALTAGDAVVIDDVDLSDRIRVSVIQETDDHSAQWMVFRFSPEPRNAFHVTERDDQLVAVYQNAADRAAEDFEILVDGDVGDVQPSDQYDTLTEGDELELGTVTAGTEITIEWTVPDEPREIADHVVAPDAEFDFDYRPDDEEVRVEHAGGDEIDADEIGVVIEPHREEPTGWESHDTVTEGDATTVDVDTDLPEEHPIIAVVLFRGDRPIVSEQLD